MADNTERSGLISVTGLWARRSKDGGTFYAGNSGNLSFMVFPIKNRTKDNSPEYNLVIGQNTPRPENGNAEAGQVAVAEMETQTEDDLPF